MNNKKLEIFICFVFMTSLLATAYVSWLHGNAPGKVFSVINGLIAFSFFNIIRNNLKG